MHVDTIEKAEVGLTAFPPAQMQGHHACRNFPDIQGCHAW